MAVTNRSDATMALSEAINTLNSRIVKTETDFIGHLQKVEDRLDQIVDLTRTVAVMQHQYSAQSDLITEVRNQIRDSAAKHDSSISRIHSRLDEIATHQRDKLELYTKDFDIKVDAVKGKTEAIDKELKAWLNRGWGAWVVFILVMGTVQTIMYRWVDAIEKEKVVSVQVMRELTSFKDRTESYTKMHEIETLELKQTVKKNTEALRDLEDINARRAVMK